MPTPTPHPSLAAAVQSLPLLAFSTSSGILISLTSSASTLLGEAQVNGKLPALSVTDLLGGLGKEAGGGEAARTIEKLRVLAKQTEELPWGQGVVLEYWPTGQREGKGEKVIGRVTFASSPGQTGGEEEEVCTVLFLRPADLDERRGTQKMLSSPSAPNPPASASSSASFSSSVYAASSASSSSPHRPSATTSTPDAPPRTLDQLVDSISPNSIPPPPKRTTRPKTGVERVTQPVPKSLADALSHITTHYEEKSGSGAAWTPLSPPTVVSSSSSSTAPPPPPPAAVEKPVLYGTDAPRPVSDAAELSTSPFEAPPRPSMPTRTPSTSNTSSSSASASPSTSAYVSERQQRRQRNSSVTHEPRTQYSLEQEKTVIAPMNDLLAAMEPDAEERKLRPSLSLELANECIETISQMVFTSAPDGRILWLSSKWFDFCGGDERYLLSEESWISCFHSDDLPNVLQVYLGAVRDGTDFSFEYRIRSKTGEYVWHRTDGRCARDADNNVLRFHSSITNIHEEVRIRHASLLIKERTRAVLESSSLTLLTVNSEGLITFFEGGRPPWMGQESATIAGQSFADLWRQAPQLNEAIQHIFEEEVTEVEVDGVALDGEGKRHFHRYRLVGIRGDPSIPSAHPDAQAITGVVIVARDQTDLIIAEERLERTRQETAQAKASELAAKEANRLKTEFLTTVSHEIRTPIASILGICELLLGDQISEEQRQLVTKAIQSGENLLELVGTVLDVRKVETGELQLEQASFSISTIVDDARLFKVTAERKGLKFTEDIQPYFEGLILADRLRLRQILANALSNAVKFTNEGSVSLHLRQLEETDSSVTVEFVVEDTGVGISSEVLPTLFVPFRQADTSTARQFGGSGLGLTIARKLAELMGGSVTLSSPGANLGSRMTIVVPLSKAPSPPTPIRSPPLPASPIEYSSSGGILPRLPATPRVVEHSRKPEEVKVLLAEDNALIREIVTKTLGKMKFSIFAVKDGRECVEQVEKDDYDVILMDGQMPIMDGYAATAAIRKHSNPRIRNLRIIALTASAIAGDMERCLESGMDGYLAKPVRAKELEAAIWSQVDAASSRS